MALMYECILASPALAMGAQIGRALTGIILESPVSKVALKAIACWFISLKCNTVNKKNTLFGRLEFFFCEFPDCVYKEQNRCRQEHHCDRNAVLPDIGVIPE